MENFVEIEAKIEKGYTYIYKHDSKNACEIWLTAWEELKTLMEDDGISDIQGIDDKYPWKEFISNFVQDLEMELGNAGTDDKSYYQKRITYCKELCERCGTEQLMRENTRRAIAESYFELGEYEQSEREFEAMIQEDPTFGWAYIGWADCYVWNLEEPQYDKAYSILDRGLSQTGLRDRKDVLERAVDFSKESGNEEKGSFYKKELRQVSAASAVKAGRNERQSTGGQSPSVTASAAKVGRNEPCPCGSGKKYKKCCGA